MKVVWIMHARKFAHAIAPPDLEGFARPLCRWRGVADMPRDLALDWHPVPRAVGAWGRYYDAWSRDPESWKTGFDAEDFWPEWREPRVRLCSICLEALAEMRHAARQSP